MCNNSNNILYTGVTSDIVKRIYEHKTAVSKSSFTAQYNITKLVYFEVFYDAYNAISREKQIKKGNRQKKIALISGMNPNWVDLYDEIATSSH